MFIYLNTHLAMRRILRDVYEMYTFDPREAIINSALSVTLWTQALNMYAFSKENID